MLVIENFNIESDMKWRFLHIEEFYVKEGMDLN
jgi:hypothetical protein